MRKTCCIRNPALKRRRTAWRLTTASAMFSATLAAHAGNFPGEPLIFPDITFIGRFDQQRGHGPDSEVQPALNLFYALDHGRLRLLGEILLSKNVQTVERLQLGWLLGGSSLWLGRYHNPIGYWNTAFHHGAFIQTAVSRPGLLAFEPAGGPLPMHLTGALLEGNHEAAGIGWHYTLGLGVAPLRGAQLQAFDIFSPDTSNALGATIRLGLQPASYARDEVGFSVSYANIPGTSDRIPEVEQAVANIYGDWHFGSLRTLGEAFYVHNNVGVGPNSRGGDLFNAYAQIEWTAAQDWTLFGRAEGTDRIQNDPYLVAFPKFVEDRLAGGVRYRLLHNTVLKLEISREHVGQDHYGQIGLQWSAVLP